MLAADWNIRFSAFFSWGTTLFQQLWCIANAFFRQILLQGWSVNFCEALWFHIDSYYTTLPCCMISVRNSWTFLNNAVPWLNKEKHQLFWSTAKFNFEPHLNFFCLPAVKPGSIMYRHLDFTQDMCGHVKSAYIIAAKRHKEHVTTGFNCQILNSGLTKYR